MLVHRRVTPSIKFAGTHLYTWVERGAVKVKCLAQEHNTMSPARPLDPESSSLGGHRASHADPTSFLWINYIPNILFSDNFACLTTEQSLLNKYTLNKPLNHGAQFLAHVNNQQLLEFVE